MSDDWNTVTVLRGKQAKPGAAKSSQAVNAARRRGEEVSTEQKYGAGGNKHTGTSLNTTKLANETEELKHQTVSMDVGRLIQKGRQAKVNIRVIVGVIGVFGHLHLMSLVIAYSNPDLHKYFIEYEPERLGNKNLRKTASCKRI